MIIQPSCEKDGKLIIILLLLLAVVSAYIFIYFSAPIQPDEITTLYNNSRFIIDGFLYIPHYKTCGIDQIQIPYILWPISLFNSLYAYIDNAFFIRLAGLLPLLILCFSISIHAKYHGLRWLKSLLLSMVLTILVLYTGSSLWNFTVRAEHQIYLFFALIIILNSLISYGCKKTLLLLVYAATVFIWLSSAYQHPKSLYFLPLIIFVSWRMVYDYKDNGCNNTYYILACAAFILFSVYALIGFNMKRFGLCEENYEFEKWLKSTSINAADLLLHPTEYFENFMSSWKTHYENLFSRAPNNLSYTSTPDINYLPVVEQKGYAINLVNNIIKMNYFAELHFAIVFLFVGIYVTVKKLYLKITTGYKIEIDINLYWVWLVYFCVIVTILHNRTNNAYDVQYWHVILMINTFYFLVPHAFKLSAKIFARTVASFILIGILSLFVAHRHYYKTFVGAWSIGTFAGPNMPTKMLNLDFQNHVRDIYELCKRPDESKSILIVDDRTYMPLRNHRNISMVTYLMLPSYAFREKIDGYLHLDNFLSLYQSAVFIGACTYSGELPLSMKKYYWANEFDLCCFSNNQ